VLVVGPLTTTAWADETASHTAERFGEDAVAASAGSP
jgi:hypothetical protein